MFCSIYSIVTCQGKRKFSSKTYKHDGITQKCRYAITCANEQTDIEAKNIPIVEEMHYE